MKIIKPYYIIETPIINEEEILVFIEKAGRTAYKSEDRITSDSAKKFIASIIKSGHESVIEHFTISVRFICDRGISHELVRHRIASFTQESGRYCNYSKDKFNKEITVIEPFFWEKDSIQYLLWKEHCEDAELTYLALLEEGATPEQARSVLPNSLKTEVFQTMNLREWRHFLKLRTSKKAHPQMRELVIPLLREFQSEFPTFFSDIIIEE